jgi:hypothetical protein
VLATGAGRTAVGFLIALGLICVVWAVVAAVLIAGSLHKRGMTISFVWLRLMVLKYLHEYARVTREETGHVGPLFYHYVVPLNVALVIVIILAIGYWV